MIIFLTGDVFPLIQGNIPSLLFLMAVGSDVLCCCYPVFLNRQKLPKLDSPKEKKQ